MLLTNNCFHLGQCEIPYTLVHNFILISKNCMFSSLFANVAAYFHTFKGLSDVRVLDCVITDCHILAYTICSLPRGMIRCSTISSPLYFQACCCVKEAGSTPLKM